MIHLLSKQAGIEILMSYDMGDDFLKRGWVGWWVAVTTGHDIPSMLTSSYYGRRLTMGTVKVAHAYPQNPAITRSTMLSMRNDFSCTGH